MDNGFRQLAVRGVKWTSIDIIGSAVLKLLQFVILAHYLSTDEFGMMAIVTATVSFSGMFLDMGLGAAIIHELDIGVDELSSIYWLGILVSLFLFGCIFMLAPAIAAFYGEKELLGLVRYVSIVFIISGLGNQFAVLLHKNFQFRVLSIINLTGTVISFIFAVMLAMDGYGVYSLVYSAIINAAVLSGFYMMYGRRIHQPKLIMNFKKIKHLLSFGFFQVGERTVNYLSSQFDVLLIGKVFGTESLGLYSVAKNIATKPYQIINPIINKVIFPIMSKVQNDMVRLKAIYLKSINVVASLNYPIYIFVILMAPELLTLLFGEKWLGAAEILQVMAVYRLFTCVLNPIGYLQLAKGRADLGFYWNLALVFLFVLVIYYASSWSLLSIVYGLLILQIVLFFPSWYFLIKPLSGASFKEYTILLVRALIIASVGGATGYALNWMISPNNIFWELTIYIGIMMGVSLVLNRRVNPDFYEIFGSMDIFHKNISK